MKKMNNKGFTIVELVIVIAVIAILAAVMIPTFSGVVTKAEQSAAVQEVKSAYTATLADDLDGTNNPVIVKGKAIHVAYTGFVVAIDANGQTTVVNTAPASSTQVYYNAGKLQASAPTP